LNDVAVAIYRVRYDFSGVKKILIIDLDYHQGDGNLSIFRGDPDVFTFSMNAAHWLDSDQSNNLDIFLSPRCRGGEYLSELKRHLPGILTAFHPDLVFFIAGSDVYENDAIGDLQLTRDDVLQRNMFVYNTVVNGGIPLVIVAGGGYGSESWYLYYDFIESAILN
jgi:acetoin utilization deacetylase AcuC-like enzyme